eukprot:COSAG06_NODE_30084_length_545_cov_0.699552_1_plen_86_part_00
MVRQPQARNAASRAQPPQAMRTRCDARGDDAAARQACDETATRETSEGIKRTTRMTSAAYPCISTTGAPESLLRISMSISAASEP